MTPEEQISAYLSDTGLDLDACNVYIVLSKAGPTSALQLAKQTGISRTQIYRHLEQLATFNLVSEEKLTYGTLFRALPISNLDNILNERLYNAQTLQSSLGDIAATMRQLAGGPREESTAVRHYYGLAGIKQANWNLTKATKEYYVFEVAHITEHMDPKFALRMRERCLERGLVSHDLTNRPTVTAKDLEPFNPSLTNYRYIDPKVLTINFEMYMYDDTVTLIDYSPENMHAIEINNPLLAKMMHQVYMAIWSQAEPINIT